MLNHQVALLQNQSEYYWAEQEGAIPIGQYTDIIIIFIYCRHNCFKFVRPRDINILFQKPKWRLLYEITKKILLTCLELLALFALAFARVKNANGITPVVQAILYLWYIHFEITGDSENLRVVLNSVIYPQIVPFFVLNRIFFPASEKGTIKQHNQTDFKSRLK